MTRQGYRGKTMLALILGVVAGYGLGWLQAHYTIAASCRRLGGFFIHGAVFKCVEECREQTAKQSGEENASSK